MEYTEKKYHFWIFVYSISALAGCLFPIFIYGTAQAREAWGDEVIYAYIFFVVLLSVFSLVSFFRWKTWNISIKQEKNIEMKIIFPHDLGSIGKSEQIKDIKESKTL